MNEKLQHFVLPAGSGMAYRLTRGAAIRIINTSGSQVVDTWAFSPADPTEFMSMEHCRVHLRRMSPRVGDTLVTNRYRPLLALVEDTSGGVHDTLLAACDKYRYAQLGCVERHDNCADNLSSALADIGLHVPHIPAPLNLFENAVPDMNGVIAIKPPISRPASYVTLRAEASLVLVLSACPQDIALTNGVARRPRDVHLEILGSHAYAEFADERAET